MIDPETLDKFQALEAQLAAEPYKFDFYQLLRSVERLRSDLPRLGRARLPEHEPIRLGQEPSLTFAASPISGFEKKDPKKPGRLKVRFFGAFGPNGPLPLHLTEYARERQRNSHDRTFGAFLDIFHHRLLELFYRAWADGRPCVQRDRPSEDRFRWYVGALAGIGDPALRDRDLISDTAKLHLAGLFAAQSRSADHVSRVLASYFSVPCEVESFIGHWFELPEQYQCRLGESPDSGCLGTTLVLGDRTWNCQHRFRIVFGPVGHEDYERLLEDERIERLKHLVRNLLGQEFEWDVKIILKKEEVPAVRLGEAGQLGRTTWLFQGEPAQDVADLVLGPYS